MEKIKPNQEQFQDYFKLKPQRAVERLLQQNDLEKSFEFYNYLQQTVKSNTNQLRSVLYKNHENLFECSQAIRRIQNFSEKVKQIQLEINTLLNAKLQQTLFNQDDVYLNNPVTKIQELILEKKFLAAMCLCSNYIQKGEQKSQIDCHIQYLKYFKVQIIEKLEQKLRKESLTAEIIKETVQVLNKFMEMTTFQQLSDITENDQCDYLNHEIKKSLLTLIFQRLEEPTHKLTNNQIIEIIFKFKLFGINSDDYLTHSYFDQEADRIQTVYKRIYQFFDDLNKLLTVSVQQRQQLSKVFYINVKYIIDHISEILIVDSKKAKGQQNTSNYSKNLEEITITFESDIYEKLIDSEQFIELLRLLENNLGKNNGIVNENQSDKIFLNQPNNLIGMIHNLWKDFYQQLLDLVFQKVNPLLKMKIQRNSQKVASQFKRFKIEKYSKLTKLKISNYKKSLNCLFENFNELIKKSKNEEKSHIFIYFSGIVFNVNKNIKQFLFSKLTELKNTTCQIDECEIREIILLIILIEGYNLSWSKLFIQESNQSINLLKSTITVDDIVFDLDDKNSQDLEIVFEIVNVFLQKKMLKSKILSGNISIIQRWQQQMDLFFAQYSQNIFQDQQIFNKFQSFLLNLIKFKLKQIS